LGRGSPAFDPVLWTMHVELVGSCALYVLYRFTHPSIRIYLLPVLVVLLLALSRPTYAAVATGAFLRELWASHGVRARWPSGVLLCGLMVTFFIPPVSSNAGNTAYWAAAAAIVYAVLASEKMQALLTARVCQFLGRISFALYLVHFPVTATIGTLIDSLLGEGHIAGAVTFPIVVALSIPLAYLGTVAIDEPLLRALHRFPNLPALGLGLHKKTS
jgi:peptidoglycan/LPS O-acetylase OafA/YrhL